jgi:hypothetical protein
MKKPSRATPFVGFLSATFCPPWSLFRKALIRAAKTSHTAGTLCEMGTQVFLKYYNMGIDKVKIRCKYMIKEELYGKIKERTILFILVLVVY